MATVGLSFGNLATGSGFDVATTVSSILAIESGIETPWKNQLTSLQAQDTAFSSLGTDLSSLSSAMSSLTSFDGVMFSKLGSSSDTNVLTLSSASSSSIAGSHTVTVTSLASTSSVYSDRITNASDTLSGTLEIQVGSSDQTITIDSSNNTLKTLAASINSGSYGVTASVVHDTAGYRLSLVSTQSGSGGQITLTPSLTDTGNSGESLAFHTGQNGADAILNVDGLDTTSASNTVTSAIPGVTFQLLSAAPNTSVQVQITNDNSSIETAFTTFVTAYNKVVTDMATQEGKDSTGKAEPLFGNPTLQAIQTQLSQALNTGTAVGAIANMQHLGLSVGQDGKLTLDNSVLDAALNSNFADVTGFLQNTGSFGQNLTNTINSLGSVSTKGAIYLALKENTAKEDALNDSIADEEARLAVQKTSLTAELNLANQIIQSIPDQLSEINQIYSAETGYNTGNGG